MMLFSGVEMTFLNGSVDRCITLALIVLITLININDTSVNESMVKVRVSDEETLWVKSDTDDDSGEYCDTLDTGHILLSCVSLSILSSKILTLNKTVDTMCNLTW